MQKDQSLDSSSPVQKKKPYQCMLNTEETILVVGKVLHIWLPCHPQYPPLHSPSHIHYT